MAWISAIVFVGVGIALIVMRRRAARVQSFLAGGNMMPGCAVAEGVAFIVLAIVVLWFAMNDPLR
jgi:putative Ca2+/H+ antiporter (TMEM165/GDT1 family)